MILLLNLFFLVLLTPASSAFLRAETLKEELQSAFRSRQQRVSFELEAGINRVNLQDLERIIETARRETDDYFRFTIDSWNLEVEGNRRQTKVQIDLQYLSTQSEDQYVFKRVANIASELLDSGLNSDQQIKAVNDYLMERIAYDHTLANGTAYDALRTGSATCQGYALLTYLLLEEIGLETKIITGNLRGEPEPHAWNLVKLAGNWYHLDVTQNASHYRNQSQLAYGWYNLSDQAISSTHTWRSAEYPAAETSYLSTLKEMIETNPDQQAVYQQLIASLKLYYLQEKYTMVSSAALQRRLQEALEQKEEAFTVRTTEDFFAVERVNRLLTQLRRQNSELPRLKSFNLEQVAYNRDTYQNTILLSIKLNYL